MKITNPLTLARFLASAASSALGLAGLGTSDVDMLRRQVEDATGDQAPHDAADLAVWCLERSLALTKGLKS